MLPLRSPALRHGLPATPGSVWRRGASVTSPHIVLMKKMKPAVVSTQRHHGDVVMDFIPKGIFFLKNENSWWAAPHSEVLKSFSVGVTIIPMTTFSLAKNLQILAMDLFLCALSEYSFELIVQQIFQNAKKRKKKKKKKWLRMRCHGLSLLNAAFYANANVALACKPLAPPDMLLTSCETLMRWGLYLWPDPPPLLYFSTVVNLMSQFKRESLTCSSSQRKWPSGPFDHLTVKFHLLVD